jgi:hypothetical protein
MKLILWSVLIISQDNLKKLVAKNVCINAGSYE